MMDLNRKSWIPMILVFLVSLMMIHCKVVEEPVEPRPMNVLFLGHDSEHHNARAFMPMLQASLAPEGFHFTYTSDPEDLSTDILKDYDAVMLYANHDEITDSQAKALLAFVKQGGGFVPVHSASYCFRNSKDVVKLIGGQFESHDTATFMAKIVVPEHPAMQGVTEFSSWDETYKHTKLTGDRTVLMERVDADGQEPYTWVKDYGRGRVFYTALGHDERTWAKPEFHQLLEQGLRWAIGDRKADALAKLDLPSLQYSEATIPNYENRNPPPKLQAPLDPVASQKRIQIPPGFSLQLFAAEPDILKPISAAWDHRGRLWLLESQDYPNEINLTDGAGNDRIKILEDTDGDGKADKFTIFADKLSVPTSLVFANGGVIVSQAPHFLFLKDTDDDDVADERQILFSGWGTFDTHAGPSNLQYGFDNKIWGVVGYSSFEGKVGNDMLVFRQGAYRFNPDGSWLEFMGATSNNTWGLGFTEAFDVLISTANNTHSAFLGIPHRFFNEVEGLKIKSVKKIDGHYAFHPNTDKVRQVDVFGGFTAAAGHHLYTARDYPQEYWNRIALVCEPTGHLLHRAIIEQNGAGFIEKDGYNLLASSDEWVSPVHAQVGPDGAVWILDWYNFIIQHNPTPQGFLNGPGNAHINPLRDKDHGRIYRLSYDGADNKSYPEIGDEKLENCIAALSNDNLFWRLHAQRIMVENNYLQAKNSLIDLVNDKNVDAIGLNPGAIHALWTLHGLNLIDAAEKEVMDAVYGALKHPSAAVRKNAIRVLDPSEMNLIKIRDAKLWADKDGGVRLAAILNLIEQDNRDEIGATLYDLSREKSVMDDEWLARAVYAGAVKHKESFTRAMHASEKERIAAGFQDTKEVVDYSGEVRTDDWGNIETPGRWSKTSTVDLANFDGIIWVRKEFEVPSALAGKSAKISLGPIDDTDVTYINGRRVGGIERKWDDERIYSIPSGILKPGKNQVTVRISDSGGRGGIYGEKEQVFVQIGTDKIDLSGLWKFKIEEQFKHDVEVFQEGLNIVDLFLKHYGPYAQELSKQLPDVAQQEFDRIIDMQTIPDQMRYDIEDLEVVAGERVKIVFSNNDGMQHNLLIGTPGSLEMIGKAADQMAQSSIGVEREYIPELTVVLAAAGLVDPGETREIIWEVPDEPGVYIFVCTFPGHWRTMNGVIQVKKKEAL